MWFGDTTATFCGTPEFMAPEVVPLLRMGRWKSIILTRPALQILLEKRYGRAVDWWAFGVLMYEMLLGQSPFRGDDEDEIFDAILEDEPLYPITMPRDAVAILQKVSAACGGKRFTYRSLTMKFSCSHATPPGALGPARPTPKRLRNSHSSRTSTGMMSSTNGSLSRTSQPSLVHIPTRLP
jgi:serine/threonine protein kinase